MGNSTTIMPRNLQDSVTGTAVGEKILLDVSTFGGSFGSYEAKTFTITGVTTNTDVKTTQSMFATVPSASKVSIYSDIASTVKLNSASNSGITLIAGEEITVSGMEITDLFITTTANTVIRVILMG